MNNRLFTLAILVSAFPALASTEASLSLNKGDFIAAEKISRDGEAIVNVKLSKSGKAKIKKLNKAVLASGPHLR